MKKCYVLIDCEPYLHFRPIRIIVDIAECFIMNKIHITYKNNIVLVSSDSFVQMATMQIKHKESVELQNRPHRLW